MRTIESWLLMFMIALALAISPVCYAEEEADPDLTGTEIKEDAEDKGEEEEKEKKDTKAQQNDAVNEAEEGIAALEKKIDAGEFWDDGASGGGDAKSSSSSSSSSSSEKPSLVSFEDLQKSGIVSLGDSNLILDEMRDNWAKSGSVTDNSLVEEAYPKAADVPVTPLELEEVSTPTLVETSPTEGTPDVVAQDSSTTTAASGRSWNDAADLVEGAKEKPVLTTTEPEITHSNLTPVPSPTTTEITPEVNIGNVTELQAPDQVAEATRNAVHDLLSYQPPEEAKTSQPVLEKGPVETWSSSVTPTVPQETTVVEDVRENPLVPGESVKTDFTTEEEKAAAEIPQVVEAKPNPKGGIMDDEQAREVRREFDRVNHEVYGEPLKNQGVTYVGDDQIKSFEAGRNQLLTYAETNGGNCVWGTQQALKSLGIKPFGMVGNDYEYVDSALREASFRLATDSDDLSAKGVVSVAVNQTGSRKHMSAGVGDGVTIKRRSDVREEAGGSLGSAFSPANTVHYIYIGKKTGRVASK